MPADEVKAYEEQKIEAEKREPAYIMGPRMEYYRSKYDWWNDNWEDWWEVKQAAADAKIGQWNRYFVRMRGEYLTVVLNGVTVIDHAHLPGVPASGPIGLQSHGSGISFSNILIRR